MARARLHDLDEARAELKLRQKDQQRANFIACKNLHLTILGAIQAQDWACLEAILQQPVGDLVLAISALRGTSAVRNHLPSWERFRDETARLFGVEVLRGLT